MAIKTRKKRPTRTYVCEVCGRKFEAGQPNAKTCGQSCRSTSLKMGKRARVLGPLGIGLRNGFSDTGEPTIVYQVPIAAWPAIEAAAAVEGISADAYLDGWVRFARGRMMRQAKADQKAAMLND